MTQPVKKSDIALKRVIEKIHILLKYPADFKMTRWIFDWDDTKPTIENIGDAHSEQIALTKLQNDGCIKLRIESKPVPIDFTPDSIRYKNEKLYNNRDDYKISSILYDSPSSDKAWLDYDWAVWIIDFNGDKLEEFTRQRSSSTIQISVIKKLHKLYIKTPDTEVHLHSFTPGSLLEKMFDHVYSNQGTEIDVKRMSFETIGYKPERNLSEDLRTIGFNKLLKKYFFSVCSAERVLFNDKAEIIHSDLHKILTELKTG